MVDDSTQPAAPAPEAGAAGAAPLSAAELLDVARRPDRVFEFLLTDRRRLAGTIATGSAPAVVIALLFGCTVLASLPIGCIRGPAHWWKAGVLFAGTSLLCAPTLHVFAAYLGSRLAPLRTVALSLAIAAVAGLFALGFTPILWFLAATMQNGDLVNDRTAWIAILFVALLAGLVQVQTLVRLEPSLRSSGAPGLLLPWQVLVAFVALRMGRALDLFS